MIINSKGCDFNPRPPRGGRHFKFKPISKWVDISIHVLREEDDPFFAWQMSSHRKFQSTSSARRTTLDVVPRNARISVISIHVLREEDDSISHASYIDQSYFNPRPPRGGRLQQFFPPAGTADFNPRPPRGGRPTKLRMHTPKQLFQSTSSARRTTTFCPAATFTIFISIHVLREEDDRDRRIFMLKLRYFNPRPPRGGRPVTRIQPYYKQVFQSTSSARRTTALGVLGNLDFADFNPRPPRGGRQPVFPPVSSP